VALQWCFQQHRPGDTMRDPIQGEFFATEAIPDPAQALVREGIQNSLDASHDDKVMVRIFLSGDADALPPERAQAWFLGAWEHFSAQDSGLQSPPRPDEPCRFLLFEDFGTTGLNGDMGEWNKPNRDNPFFYFFRADGLSRKENTDRGRWGVGKTVFSRSSRANSYIGVSVRSDDSARVLMGRAVLKNHTLGENVYQPDGLLGTSDASSSLLLPVTDAEIIDRFCKDFRLERGRSPGLSVVVPWYTEEWKEDDLRKEVLRSYF